MDQTEVSNIYALSAVLSYFVCVRCLSWLGRGGHLCFGKVGCCFPVLTDEDKPLFRAWVATLESGSEHQSIKCLRCFFTNSECFAVSMGHFVP